MKKRDLIRKCDSGFGTGLLIVDNLLRLRLRLRLIEEEPPKLVERLKENSDNFDSKVIITELEASECYRLSQFGIELLRQIIE